MDKRLLRLVCDQVEAVVKNQPPSNPQSLLNLLRIAEPNLALPQLYDKDTRKSAFRSLQTLIHPDKHAASFGPDSVHAQRVTKLFQDATDFYHLCCDALTNSNHRIANGEPVQSLQGANTETAVSRYVERHSGERDSRPYAMANDDIRGRVHTDTVARYVEKRPDPPNPRPYSNTHSQDELRDIYNSQKQNSTKAHSLSPVRATAVARPTHNHQHHNQNNQLLRHRPSKSYSPVRQRAQQPPKQPQEPTGKEILEQYALSKKLPLSFDSLHVWPWLRKVGASHHANRNHRIPNHTLSWVLATRCLNSRGAVLHGQAIQQDHFRVATSSKLLQTHSSVEGVLEYFGAVGNSHLLRTKRDIQHELVQNGPVLSTAFQPDPLFFKRQEHAHHFQQLRGGDCHPVLLLGWTVTSTGELWKVQSLYDPSRIVHIGFGQWNIDRRVVAPPTVSLEEIPWQTPGPYLDLRMPRIFPGTGDDWRRSRSMGVSITHQELETLNHLLGGFKNAIAAQQQRRHFVIRDGYQKGYSRRYILKEVLHGNESHKWKIAIERFDLPHEREEKKAVTHAPGNAIVAATTSSMALMEV